MKKRGQVTVFVIIGFLILIIIGVIFFIISAKNKFSESEITASSIDEVRRQVNLDVKLCFENIVENGILDGARHGGNAVLMNKLGSDSVRESGLDICKTLLTATQEIRLAFGPNRKYTQDSVCVLYDSNNIAINEEQINDDTVLNFVSAPLDLNNFENSLKNYLSDRLPRCLNEFNQYKTKGWGIGTLNVENIDDVGGVAELLKQRKDEYIIINPGFDTSCPMEGKFVASLKMPLKFSRVRSIGNEESFVLDNQEFIYNANLKYFYTKSDELLKDLLSIGFEQTKISEMPNAGVCKNCWDIKDGLVEFERKVEDPSSGGCDGCHFYKATDPNTGAYFFNIKCGEYFMSLNNPINVNGKEIVLKEANVDNIIVSVDGVSGETINKDSTVDVGGIDFTFDNYDQDTGKVTLIIGESLSYLWGYYFGCSSNVDICFIECDNNMGPATMQPNDC